MINAIILCVVLVECYWHFAGRYARLETTLDYWRLVIIGMIIGSVSINVFVPSVGAIQFLIISVVNFGICEYLNRYGL